MIPNEEGCVKISVISEDNEEKPIDTENTNRTSLPDLVQKSKLDESIIQKKERSKSLDPLKSRISSIMSLNELRGDVLMNDDRKW